MAQEIELNQTHVCSKNNCAMGMISEGNDSFTWGPNPDYKDGKCSESGEKEICLVYIASYNPDDWEANHHQFDDPDEIVITDEEIKINFSYPLKDVFTFSFKSQGGFTRKQIVDYVVRTYQRIYREEEETAEEQEWHFVGKCRRCEKEVLMDERIVPYHELKSDQQAVGDNPDDLGLKYLEEKCLICFAQYQEEEVLRVLPCGHSAHQSCLDDWLKQNYQDKHCPICQQQVSTKFEQPCGNCDDGQVSFDYKGKVLPLELRRKQGGLLNRHATNGKYGIWGHDIGDLVIEGITYRNGTLYLSIGS